MTPTYRRSKVQHRLPSNKCFLMVVLDFDINNMYWLVEFAAPTEQIYIVYLLINPPRVTDGPTITYSVETALLAGDYHIGNSFAILPPFWSQFDSAIPV